MQPTRSSIIPKIVTISGTTGSGKTSIVGKVLQLNMVAKMIVSHTSRGPRPSDLPGEYNYKIPAEYFDNERDSFLWVVTAHETTYGTTRDSVLKALDDPSIWFMILVPDAVEKLRAYLKESTGSDEQVLSFYVLSPGEIELQRRLSDRKDDAVAIQKRVADSKKAQVYDEQALKSDIPYVFLTNSEPGIGIEKAAQQILVFL